MVGNDLAWAWAGFGGADQLYIQLYIRVATSENLPSAPGFNAMLRFYVTVHAQPAEIEVGDPITIGNRTLRPLRVSPEALSTTAMPTSFEDAAARLAALERLYCEPDGSFVWTSGQRERSWQVDGNLYDRHERLLFVDLKGTCPAGEFDRLLAAFGWPETKLMFQLTREALFLDEAEFRRCAAGG